MKILIAFSLLIMGCQITPSNPEKGAEKQINACLPNAIIMSSALRRQGVWAKVLEVKWESTNKINGHAYTIYLYPPSKNQLWAYDRDWGSTRIRAFKDDPRMVAEKANSSRAIYYPIKRAEYLD